MITGKITQLVPDGGYAGQNGYITTFQMTIQPDTGGTTITGQIGSKSSVYPLAIGSPITVDLTNTQHGVRLKKINPQYAAQDGQQAAPQPTGAANSSKGQPIPVDATRLSIERQCAIKSACTFLAGKTETTTQEVADAAMLFANFMATGRPFFKGNEDGLMDKPESQDKGQPTKTQPLITEYPQPEEGGEIPF